MLELGLPVKHIILHCQACCATLLNNAPCDIHFLSEGGDKGSHKGVSSHTKTYSENPPPKLNTNSSIHYLVAGVLIAHVLYTYVFELYIAQGWEEYSWRRMGEGVTLGSHLLKHSDICQVRYTISNSVMSMLIVRGITKLARPNCKGCNTHIHKV